MDAFPGQRINTEASLGTMTPYEASSLSLQLLDVAIAAIVLYLTLRDLD